MLASMVLSENGARVWKTRWRIAERRVEKKKRAARDANAARPSVFVEPCDVCLALREVASKNVPNGKKDAAARTKLCSRCQVKARDLAIEEVRRGARRPRRRRRTSPTRRGGASFPRRTRRRWPRKSARARRTSGRCGTRRTRGGVRPPGEGPARDGEGGGAGENDGGARGRRCTAQGERCAAGMETATHERERELTRERVVAAMGARRKEGPMEEDENARVIFLLYRYDSSLHSPTQELRPLTLCTGPTTGSVTAHSYHTFPARRTASSAPPRPRRRARPPARAGGSISGTS